MNSPTPIFLLFLFLHVRLGVDYYHDSCPDVESIVRSAVKAKLEQTFVTAPATLRLFFHDCFVRGCDASVMLASSRNRSAEKDNSDNLSLAGDGLDTVMKAKAAVDSVPQCQNKVSCADILALATRDVVALTGGPSYAVELGRLDGRISTKSSMRHLPYPEFKLGKLKDRFASHGLTLTDLVALSGAHSIGFSHCSRFSKRIYKFKSKSRMDPTFNLPYARQLQQMCPEKVDPRMAIEMDPGTTRTFDNMYYVNLQQGMGLFSSDQTL